MVNNNYKYDVYGNCIEKEMLTGTCKYEYDELNQLTKVQYPEYTENYEYDKAGNRTKRTLLDYGTSNKQPEGTIVQVTKEEIYKYNIANRLEKLETITKDKKEVREYVYDACGNMKYDGDYSYTYDIFGRTESAYNSENYQINRYDAEGLRYEVEENNKLIQYIYNENKEIVEEENESKATRYIRGYELISSDSEEARNYYHYASDERGSITHVLEETKVRNYYEYDAFGNITNQHEEVENIFKYAGEKYDNVTGQYYLRARYYNPVIGRFTQQDTYHGDGLNLYSYVANNPLKYVDPSGHNIVSFERGIYALGDTEKDIEEAIKADKERKMLIDTKNNPEKKKIFVILRGISEDYGTNNTETIR